VSLGVVDIRCVSSSGLTNGLVKNNGH
jgi:hypothetical protein